MINLSFNSASLLFMLFCLVLFLAVLIFFTLKGTFKSDSKKYYKEVSLKNE